LISVTNSSCYFLGVIVVAPVFESTGGFVVVQPTAATKIKHNTTETKTEFFLLAIITIVLIVNIQVKRQSYYKIVTIPY
jgi:hypothetical protein